jgi:integrase
MNNQITVASHPLEGVLPSPEIADVEAAFAQFLMVDVANGDATADIIKAYAREVKYFLAWCHEEEVLPERARRSHIEAYREWLKARGLSAATRQHKMSIVRRFYEAAVKHELIKINPANNVKGGKDLISSGSIPRSLLRKNLEALRPQGIHRYSAACCGEFHLRPKKSSNRFRFVPGQNHIRGRRTCAGFRTAIELGGK